MPGRVNINIPPRVIESARAAQYANREVLDGRALTEKIKAKVQARRAVVLRQQPGAAPDRGDDSPPARGPLKWRIWRKRRPRKPVDVGVGWLHIGKNHTVITDEFEIINETDADEINISPTYERRTINGSGSASLEFVVTVGARSGERWKQFRHSLAFSYAGTDFFEKTWTRIEDGLIDIVLVEERRSVNGTNNFFVGLWWNLLPAGQSDMILVVSMAQYHSDIAYEQYGSDPGVFSRNSFTVQNTTHTCFLVTESDVVELTQPLPAFMQKKIDSVPAEYAAGNTTYGFINNVNSLIPARLAVPQPAIGVYQINHPNPYVATELSLSQPAASPYRIGFNSVSSVVYESIAPDGTFSAVSAQQAKESYAEYSRIAEIPVLGYKIERDPVILSTPTAERGVFGIIPNASVTLPVTAKMLAAGLDDELEQVPGPNAANQPEPVQMVVAYDYHGGSYCRDRLTQMGINL
jgi:hypothetical protein